MGFFDFLKGVFGGRKGTSQKVKCPNCGEDVSLDEKNCMECGAEIAAVLRIKCPKCGEPNDAGEAKCIKCGSRLTVEEPKEEEVSYRCFVCGNVSDSFFTVCPVCGTRTA